MLIKALRITSYNVCYTKLLRVSRLEGGRERLQRVEGRPPHRLLRGAHPLLQLRLVGLLGELESYNFV